MEGGIHSTRHKLMPLLKNVNSEKQELKQYKLFYISCKFKDYVHGIDFLGDKHRWLSFGKELYSKS